MTTSADLVMMGFGKSVTLTVSFALHPLAVVPDTTYCVVELGVATGFAMFELFSPAEGLHTDVAAPVVFSWTWPTEQNDVSLFVFTIGLSTVTTVVSVDVLLQTVSVI